MTVIVMLILAGVSLNAIVGDNGIITNAQNANMKSGMAALEEWLQEKYVEYYEDSDNYVNKIELLNDKIPSLLLRNSTSRKYIIYGGKAYYLINKSSLPDEIKGQLIGGNSTEVADYTKLYDVYGVTPDLKIYYVNMANETTYGNVDSSTIDPNTALSMLNNSTYSGLNEAVTEALADNGVTVDNALGITIGNIVALKELTLDGNKYTITSLKAISEATNLQKLILKNLTLSNLEGIESLSVLNYVYFYNCDISDYAELCSIYKLNKLYFHFLNSMNETTTNAQITRLGNALADGTKITNLQYLGLFSVNLDSTLTNHRWSSSFSNGEYYNGYERAERSNLSDVSGLEKFSNNIKSTVIFVMLNNNNLTNINSLTGFGGIEQLIVAQNSNLSSLSGLENHVKLKYIGAHRCNLTNLSGLKGCTNIKLLSVVYNRNLTSISGIEDAIDLDSFQGGACDITDISSLVGLTKLSNLYLWDNTNLEHVSVISNCTGLKLLHLGGDVNMIASEVGSLSNIIKQCDPNYWIPNKYMSVLSTLTAYNYSGCGLTDDSIEFTGLTNRTNVTRLNLTNNTSLTNNGLNQVLATMTGLQYLSLRGISNLTSIDWIKTVPDLRELDLRGTNVTSKTDISLLNTYGTQLRTLVIDNGNIDIKDIEDTIININTNGSPSGANSWISTDPTAVHGAMFLNSSYDYSKLTRLTRYDIRF